MPKKAKKSRQTLFKTLYDLRGELVLLVAALLIGVMSVRHAILERSEPGRVPAQVSEHAWP